MLIVKTIVSFIKDKEYRDLLWTTATTLGVGTLVYHFLEGWSWIDSLYFAMALLHKEIGYNSPIIFSF